MGAVLGAVSPADIAILFTAPLGAFGMELTYKKLLKKSEVG